MKNFLKGFLVGIIALPIIDGLISIYNQSVEFVNTKIAAKTYKIKLELQESEEAGEKVDNGIAIGFQVPSEEEEYYEEEDDDE